MSELGAQPYGYRARIGYTSPPLTTEVFPYEFYRIAPKGVSLVITSLAIITRSKDELDQSYDISVRAAREMRDAGVDLVCLGGVPINQHRGYDNADQLAIDLEKELGIKISTSASAQTAAGKRLGVKKAVLAHPYAQTNTARVSASYEHMLNCEVIGSTCFGAPFDRNGAIPQNAAVEMGRRLIREHPHADTIQFPSPHWPTTQALDILEIEFGITCLGAHQGIMWDALRRCGIAEKLAGFGRLFRDF